MILFFSMYFKLLLVRNRVSVCDLVGYLIIDREKGKVSLYFGFWRVYDCIDVVFR